MLKPIHLAIGSTLSRPGDLAANLDAIARFATRAAEAGAHLLLTPELSATGYGNYPEVLDLAEPAGDGPIHERLAAEAARTRVALCAGFVERAEEGRLHLAHYALFPDGRFVVQRKYRVTGAETPMASAAPHGVDPWSDSCGLGDAGRFPIFEVAGARCAIVICADVGIPGLDERLEREGLEVLLCPVGAGGAKEKCVTTADLATPDGRAKYRGFLEQVFFPGNGIEESIRHRRALAAVNQCGWDGRSHAHVGHGMIITPLGEVPAFFHGIPNLDRQRECFASALLDIGEKVP